MILIIGASGKAGGRVARRLLERGEAVRAVSRDPSKLADLAARGAEPVRGDLRDGAWMDEALRGVHGLVLASHGLVPPTRANNPERADDAGNRRIMNAAKRAGVAHVVFLSVAKAAADAPVAFSRIKHGVEEHLRASGLRHTIVRPTVFTETHAVQLMAEPLRRGSRVVFLGSGRTRLNWISVDDVAGFVLRALEAPGSENATATIGGPDQLSRLEVLERIERIVGRTARRTHVPLPVLRAVRALLGPVNPGVRYLLEFAIAEDTLPEFSGCAPAELDWIGPTSLDEVIRAPTAAR